MRKKMKRYYTELGIRIVSFEWFLEGLRLQDGAARRPKEIRPPLQYDEYLSEGVSCLNGAVLLFN